MKIEDLQGGILALSLLGPGFLIMFGRSRFLTGRMVSVASSIFEYLMVSSIYFAASFPIYKIIGSNSYWSMFNFLFVLPLFVGFSLGLFAQKGIFRSLLARVGLNPVHSSPTAWDYVFGNREGSSWVVVKLFSGNEYYGVLGPASMASSDLKSRDIFLENTCRDDFSFVEVDRKRGVWINESDIRAIEIIKDK
ncbi:DUF6338 family protein [Roseobacter sp. GAI101]|uniref:DUF6338 family protein n=1 Tax=Roseobacter sp. (strain GAI101) TaxID=391589 RepID=UPI0012EE6266|nr:DUF6338 family protein [Roseobacter sp. GAI101]